MNTAPDEILEYITTFLNPHEHVMFIRASARVTRKVYTKKELQKYIIIRLNTKGLLPDSLRVCKYFNMKYLIKYGTDALIDYYERPCYELESDRIYYMFKYKPEIAARRFIGYRTIRQGVYYGEANNLPPMLSYTSQEFQDKYKYS
jgi:hypothetical protein